MTSLRYLIAKALPLVATIGMCLTALVSCVAVAGEFRVGAAEVKITPPLGTPMAGYLSPRCSEDVLDDLYAKATVLDDGKTKVALVTCALSVCRGPSWSRLGGSSPKRRASPPIT